MVVQFVPEVQVLIFVLAFKLIQTTPKIHYIFNKKTVVALC